MSSFFALPDAIAALGGALMLDVAVDFVLRELIFPGRLSRLERSYYVNRSPLAT